MSAPSTGEHRGDAYRMQAESVPLVPLPGPQPPHVVLDDVSAPGGSTIEQRIRKLAAQRDQARREVNELTDMHAEDLALLAEITKILDAAGWGSTAEELGPVAALRLLTERSIRIETHLTNRSRVLDERLVKLDAAQAEVRKMRQELDDRRREIDSREHAVRVEEERLAHNLRAAGSRANQIPNPSLAADVANSSWADAQPAGKQETAAAVDTPDPLAGLFRELAAVFERWSR